MASTLEIQIQLNKLLDEASEKIENMNSQYGKQTKILDAMTAAIKRMNEMLNKTSAGGKLADSFDEAKTKASEVGDTVQSSMEKATAKINESTTSSKGLAGSFGDTSKELTKMSAGIAVIGGIGKALSFVLQTGQAALQMISGIGGGIFEIGKSVLAFPFKILEGLISMSSTGGSNELAQELEEIRKQFGYLNKTAGVTIIDLAKNMKGQLANTGLSVWRTFGNLVERLRYFREYAQKLGETIDAVFRNLSVTEAEALGAFNKGLGFTDEGLKAVAQRSLATGESLNEINRQVGNFSIQLSKAFGVSMKLVSRDVGNMMADFEHFGHLAVKELTQASVYARRLGIDVKALGKLIDKYMNFEDAANSAAQLSQAFGLNIDAFKMMQEQDPAKKLEMLRKAFFATGRTVENMTIQERRLLAQQTGLGDSEIALAFAQKNRALSYDDIRKKGDAAKKSQLTQEQVLNKLAGAIERLVKSGSAMQGGFFDRFLQGFVSGIKMSKEFRELMRNLARSLTMTFYAGRQVGLMFEQLFPGVKQFFGGLRDMFNPRVMKSFLNKAVSAFKDFFKQMTTDPTTALPKLLEKLQAAFTDRFNAAGPGASKVFSGIKSFLKAVGYIFLSGIKEALLGLGKVVAPLISSIFSNDTLNKAGDQLSNSADTLGSTISKMFTEVFGTEGSPTRRKIYDSLSKFGDAIWEGAKFFIGKFAAKMPAIFETIATALSAGADSASNARPADKFVDGLAKSFEKAQPHMIKIAESLGRILISGLKTALLSAVMSETTVKMVIGNAVRPIITAIGTIPTWIAGAVSGLFESLFTSLGTGLNRFGVWIEQKLGGGLIGKAARILTSAFAFIVNIFAIGFKTISRTFLTIGTFFNDLIDGPTKALKSLKERFVRLITELSGDFRRSLNTLINAIPARIRQFFGIQPMEIPVPPPSKNPGVQMIKQIENQSAASSPVIQRNLVESVNPNISSQASASGTIADNSISERVTSIRESINSATEIGNIDQNKARQAFNRLTTFVETLGPTLRTSEIQVNQALAGIDIEGMSSKIGSIKEIFQSVSSIKRFAIKNSDAITVSNLMPLTNSLAALTEFTNSPLLKRLEGQLSSAENVARINGIKNTSDTIKDMVDTINQTSKTLAKLSPINIQTNLQRLASNLGLGSNSSYTIKNENFKVEVNLSVHMGVKEVEKILIERPDTRIRHT